MTNQKILKCFTFMLAAIITLLSSSIAAADQTTAAKGSVLSLKTDQIDEILRSSGSSK